MEHIVMEIPEVVLFKPKTFNDERGFFFESFRQEIFNQATQLETKFIQENHSFSYKNILRGLHLQALPYAQGKLVRVVRGMIFDVAVDVRKNSKTFGRYVSAVLSAENKHQLWVPPGFAHGFLALSDAEVVYKTDQYYHKDSEKIIAWNDQEIAIEWPSIDGVQNFMLANRDIENTILLKDL
ncbi:MAG: hypothetical protein DGJ47_001057 [Rickettsiaceae bacterium]